MRVVCDTNIIIDFAKILSLDLLKNIFKEVMIPVEVKEELLAGERGGTEEADIRRAIDEWAKVENVKDMLAVESLRSHIGNGEAASIILYKETKADFLAINDLKARGIAHAMGVKIIGSLGILRLAKDKGLLKEIKPSLDELRKIGAYIRDELYRRILIDAGESAFL